MAVTAVVDVDVAVSVFVVAAAVVAVSVFVVAAAVVVAVAVIAVVFAADYSQGYYHVPPNQWRLWWSHQCPF